MQDMKGQPQKAAAALPGSAALGPAGLPICMLLPQHAQQATQAEPQQGCGGADAVQDNRLSSGSQVWLTF